MYSTITFSADIIMIGDAYLSNQSSITPANWTSLNRIFVVW
jgi:hypothetical protein